MKKNPKQMSNLNISTPMPKSSLDKAKAYFKVSNKNPIAIANQLGIKIPKVFYKKDKKTGRFTDKQVVNPSNDPNSKYVNKLNQLLLDKWKDATQEYSSTYRMVFQIYNKGDKRFETIRQNIVVKGTKSKLYDNALLEFERRKKKYASDSDADLESFEFEDEPIREPILLKEGKGNIEDNNTTITTSNGGMRRVGSKGHKAYIKAKEAGAFKVSNGDNEWDRNVGTCVFDYLYWFYKKLGKGKREEVYEDLNEILRLEETENPLEEGVSIYQLENFCDYYGVAMYAFDKTDELIEYYKPKKIDKNLKALVFTIFDNHFYPVPDDERQSKVRKGSNSDENKRVSNDTESNYKKKEAKMKEVISLSQDDYDALKEELKDKKISLPNYIALQFIKDNNNQIPFPVSDKNVVNDDFAIKKLVFDDKIYLTEPINPYVKKYYGDKYQGQSYISIMNDIYKEQYNGDFTIRTAPYMSKMNIDVEKALYKENVKWRTHLGLLPVGIEMGLNTDKIRELIRTGEAVAVDICKCYSDCLYNPREDWIVFSGKEQVEKYDGGKLTLGLYFVETSDMTLFHQSNWYSKQIIKKALQEHIKFKITHQIRVIDPLWEKAKYDKDGKELYYMRNNKSLFQPFCDSVIELTEQDEDFTLSKLILNSITGMLGKTTYTQKNISLGKKLEEVWEDFVLVQAENRKNIFITELNPDENENFIYMYGYNKKINMTTNGLPMYIQILDWSNIALYDLTKAVGGTCIYRKTDCIVSIGGKIPEQKETSSYVDTFGTYRNEPNGENFHYDFIMNSNRYVEPPSILGDWVDYGFNSSNDWEQIIRTAIDKGGMLISGRAGTGKSYIVEQGVKNGLLPENPKSRLAFTNKAAKNIMGTTIHKGMGINDNGKNNEKCMIGLANAFKITIDGEDKEVVVVDEISMINNHLWRHLTQLKDTTKATFILIGDYRQCQPIEDGDQVDYFNHSVVKYLSNYNRCELTIPQRYERKLWNWLDDFYNYGVVGKDIKKKKLTIENILYRKNIVYFNKTRREVNTICMKEIIKTKDKWYELPVPTDEDGKIKCSNDWADDIYIFEGLKVMGIKNCSSYEMVNTDEYEVKSFDNENIILQRIDDNNIILSHITTNNFHTYFVANYAATAYKSQGATITEDINIWDWEDMEARVNVGYTAVSRAKKCEQITIVI